MIDDKRRLEGAAREELLRRTWYWHDARWFAAVAAEFGIGAANRINRGIVRALGQTEMRRLMRALATEHVGGVGEALHLFEAGRDLFVPASLIESSVRAAGDTAYDVAIARCFIHDNIVRAGIADLYECAVFDRIAGWHDAWGLPLVDEPAAGGCAMAAGRTCRQRFAVK
jgi:hypothetical protein